MVPIGLTNTSPTLPHFLNNTLCQFHDDFVLAHLSDIQIYWDTLQKHKIHIHYVPRALKKSVIHYNPVKCEFHAQITNYFKLILSPTSISMNKAKVVAMQVWDNSVNLHLIQSFLNFANFYNHFICQTSILVV